MPMAQSEKFCVFSNNFVDENAIEVAILISRVEHCFLISFGFFYQN